MSISVVIVVANPRYGVFCGEIHRIGCAESGGIAGLMADGGKPAPFVVYWI